MKKIIVSFVVMAILIAAIAGTTATTIRIGAQEVPETIIIKNEVKTSEVEMSKVIIMLVDKEAYSNRKIVLSLVYLSGREIKDLGIIDSVAAKVPTSLLDSGLLNSLEIKKIVPDTPVTLPKPPARYPTRYPTRYPICPK